MNALVTGGTGFVGRPLVQQLLDAGHAVTSVQRATPGRDPRARYVAADVGDRAVMQRVIDEAAPDVVYHLAGDKGFGRSLPELLVANVAATDVLIDVLSAWRRGAPLILLGSAAEYGEVPPDALPVRESQPEAPVNDYGRSKLAQGMLAHARHLRGDVSVIRVRAFNITGPGEPSSQALGSFARQIVAAERGEQEPVVRAGPLAPRRDFIDVRDVARALIAAAESGQPGALYNAASGVPTAIGTALSTMLELARVRCSIASTDSRPAGVQEIFGSTERLEAETRWTPTIPLRASLRDALEVRRAAPDGTA